MRTVVYHLAAVFAFLDEWRFPFDRERTHAAPFHVSSAQSKDAQMMHRVQGAAFAAIDGVKLLELPYRGAFVKLDEKGTEAAAVTAVLAKEGLSGHGLVKTVELNADHPFLFFIRDTRSGMILFMGRVADPTAK